MSYPRSHRLKAKRQLISKSSINLALGGASKTGIGWGRGEGGGGAKGPERGLQAVP